MAKVRFRPPLALEGGTPFTFVTAGIEEALAQARRAAQGRDVAVAGGASIAQAYLKAGLVDEMEISLAPILLGGGVRLFDGLGNDEIKLEVIRAVESPLVTHLKYRVR